MSDFTGTGRLIRLILRRDRVRIPLWYGLVALLVLGVAGSVAGAYPTDEARQAFLHTTNGDPTQLMMIGPVYDPSTGGLAAWRVRGQAALLIALASLFLVIRSTRAEEETGRAELLGSTVVGRHAALTAALTVAFAANLVTALVVTLGLTASGLPPMGSLTMGLSVAAAGCVFAALAGLAAQLTEGARTAAGLAATAMGILYAVRAIADVERSPWVSWLSPFGWTQRMRPFAGDHLWPLLPVFALILLLAAGAYWTSSRRDLGAGVLPPRLGPAGAAPSLRTALALAWRLQRGTLLAWTVAFAAFGAGLGGVARSAADQLNASEALKALIDRMGGGRPVDGFFAFVIYLTSQVITVYAIQATLRLRTEETSGRADILLTGPVGRLRWAGGHLAIVAAGSGLVLAGLGLAMGLVHGLSTGDLPGEITRLLAASLTRLPSILVLAALTALLYGLLPRLAAIVAYTALGLCLLLEFAVELLHADPSLLRLSPFAQTPGLPIAEFALTPLLLLTVIATALTTAGLTALHRRDLG
ncbi:ABC-2 type transport system permease protein [Nonomuraea solani]|uniref:ABC-2 type transport system permease protein n=1 Tax=Nonomuraea solani TaxID=1144553 RepID=A0A1H6CLQ8_9ACTN|nr:ABC transporter permease [Nonomuraea solani]SEG73882.1 ABC-2 type transport system permease protein [Nonomuraea solani]